jgi:hypothetical protein
VAARTGNPLSGLAGTVKESRWKRWKRNERERMKNRTPSGRLIEDLPDWQISAKKAATEKKKSSVGNVGQEQ